MKAFLILPAHQKIEEVHYKGNYEDINKLLDISTCTAVGLYADITSLGFITNEVAYIDDDGLFNDKHHYWIHRNFPTPLAGPGLFVGTDAEGNDIAPSTSIDQLRKDVKWVGDKHDARVMVRMFGHLGDDYRSVYFKEEENV